MKIPIRKSPVPISSRSLPIRQIAIAIHNKPQFMAVSGYEASAPIYPGKRVTDESLAHYSVYRSNMTDAPQDEEGRALSAESGWRQVPLEQACRL